MRLSLRARLLASFLVVILITGATAVIVAIWMIGDTFVEQAQKKVRLDLNSARVVYQGAIDDVRKAVTHTAVRFFIRDALAGGTVASLSSELAEIRRREGLDTLTLTDARGKVLLRATNTAVKTDSQASSELINRALTRKTAVASTEIVAREELLKDGEDLARRAYLRFVPTPRAKPMRNTENTSGMMIMAAAPVLSEQGELLGLLYGGKLLNRNFELVDKVRDTVYSGEMYAGKHVGTATIFQGDVRVSTNVTTGEGERAIGTRVSAEVRERVLDRGQLWVERAFVVNDWYITAYEPIRNISGEVVGILYVGMLERKFADMKRNALWAFVAVSLGGIALSVVICFFLSRSLSRPAKALMLSAQQLASGDLTQRVRPDDSTQEIGMLGRTFNLMAASIEERDEQLRRRAQEEVMKSERLAMIGRLAAGVAHEINNPLTGVLTFSHLLREKENLDEQDKEDLDVIINETTRASEIVRGLLDFARERPVAKEPLDVNDVIRQTVRLLANRKAFQQIAIDEDLAADLPRVDGDMNQLQQVLLNLSLNACAAMPEGGTLTISTSAEGGSVLVKVADTGSGIKAEHVDRIFEPFFSTKPVGRGTGLGLSISYGIVQQHGGELRVESEEGKGTTFTIVLPPAEDKQPDAQEEKVDE